MSAYDLTFLLMYMAGLAILFLGGDVIRLIRHDYSKSLHRPVTWKQVILSSLNWHSIHWYGIALALGFLLAAWSYMVWL